MFWRLQSVCIYEYGYLVLMEFNTVYTTFFNTLKSQCSLAVVFKERDFYGLHMRKILCIFEIWVKSRILFKTTF